MSDINNYTCTGRLGADPEARRFNDGNAVVNLRVAVSESWKDRNTGERKEKTLWLPVKITNQGLCKLAEGYLRKGSRVGLAGKLETESWERDGQKHFKTVLAITPFVGSITMLDGPREQRQSDDSRSNQSSYGSGYGSGSGGFGGQGSGPMDDADPIPF